MPLFEVVVQFNRNMSNEPLIWNMLICFYAMMPYSSQRPIHNGNIERSHEHSLHGWVQNGSMRMMSEDLTYDLDISTKVHIYLI